jgi:hypothetical protein
MGGSGEKGFVFKAQSTFMRDIIKMNVDDINKIGLEPGDWIQITFDIGTIVGKIVEDEVETGTVGLSADIVRVFNLGKNQKVTVLPYTGPLPDRRFRKL